LKKRGAKIIDVSLPNTKYGVASYYVITPSEVSSNLARLTGLRYGLDRSNFGDEAVRRIMIGTFSLSSGYYDAYYTKATQVRNLITNDFEEVFKQVDVLLTPVTPMMPPKIGEVVNDPLKNYLMDLLMIPVNMSGVPSLAIPAGFIDNIPVGLQIIGKKFSEELLYKVGKKLEDETGFYKVKPDSCI
nr:Asp-tRNA(Asn)/Glu-tRNA(Gln) amidotransferase subunit GatA [Patescibacteria group bacterium]